MFFVWPAFTLRRNLEEFKQTVKVKRLKKKKKDISHINRAEKEQWVVISFYTSYIKSRQAVSQLAPRPPTALTHPPPHSSSCHGGICPLCGGGRGGVLSLFSALNQLPNVQVRYYVIFTSSPLAFEVEPVWLVTGSPAMLVHYWLIFQFSFSLFFVNERVSSQGITVRWSV